MSKFRIKTEIGRVPFEMEVEIPEETMRRIIDNPNWSSVMQILTAYVAQRRGISDSSCFPISMTPPKEVIEGFGKYLQENAGKMASLVPKETVDRLKDVFKDDKAVPSDKKEKPNKKE